MSVCFETRIDATHYSVRQAGGSVRLYSNGVFHSQWNAARPFAGGVWDCLSLPCLYRPREATRRVLVLGVGGGAVIRQLDLLVPFETLTGIDIDAMHLTIARRWFGVDDARVSLQVDDAMAWVEHHAGEPFDLVIDDLFGHGEEEPRRAVALDAHWIEQLARVTAPEGLLVVNCLSGAALKRAGPRLRQAGFSAGYRWTQATYDNAVGVLSRQPLSPALWQRQLEACALPAAAIRAAQHATRRPLRMA